MHVVFGSIALFLGVWQFVRIRYAKYGNLHKHLGQAYVIAVFFGSIAGMLIALRIYPERMSAGLGFGTVGVLWFSFTMLGLWFARKKRFSQHKAMMIRSYALAFAAVSFRIQLPFFLEFLDAPYQVRYFAASNIIAWRSWVPNLLIVEIWLRLQRRGK